MRDREVMRALLLLNEHAGSADAAEPVVEAARARAGVRVVRCRHEREARAAAVAALEEGYDTIVAGGGDGTIGGVVNVLGAHLERVRLGILPLGTGNDLARSLGIPADPLAAWDLVCDGGERRLDLIRVRAGGEERLCVNLASGGFGGEVERAVDKETKERWGALAYLRGALAVAAELPTYEVAIRFDGGARERLEAVSVVVANGRTAGKGFAVAPPADPGDGALDVIAVHPAPAAALAGVAARLLAGDYTQSDAVSHRRARTVDVEARPPMPFSVDGSLFSSAPARFELLPRALRVAGAP